MLPDDPVRRIPDATLVAYLGMPKRLRTEEEDFNVTAFRVVQQATGQAPKATPGSPPTPKAKAPRKRRKNPAAVALGRKGGKASGKARMQKLAPERRSEIARHAAKSRWR